MKLYFCLHGVLLHRRKKSSAPWPYIYVGSHTEVTNLAYIETPVTNILKYAQREYSDWKIYRLKKL